jgi:hypothetical protein
MTVDDKKSPADDIREWVIKDAAGGARAIAEVQKHIDRLTETGSPQPVLKPKGAPQPLSPDIHKNIQAYKQEIEELKTKAIDRIRQQTDGLTPAEKQDVSKQGYKALELSEQKIDALLREDAQSKFMQPKSIQGLRFMQERGQSQRGQEKEKTVSSKFIKDEQRED